MNLKFTTIWMWWIFLLVLFLPPPYCSVLLLLFTSSGFVLTATEIQKGSSCSQNQQGPNRALRINPSIPTRCWHRFSARLNALHMGRGCFTYSKQPQWGKGFFNPQALNSKAARNIMSYSLLFHFWSDFLSVPVVSSLVLARIPRNSSSPPIILLS